MAVTFMTGFESAAALVDSLVLGGVAAYSTTQARTGTRSIRCNPGSGSTGYLSYGDANPYHHIAMYVAARPSVERRIFGVVGSGLITLRLTAAGALAVYDDTTLMGTSSAVFATAGWHWVSIRQVTGTGVVFLQIDGVDEVTGTATVTSVNSIWGFAGTEASAVDVYFDDVIVDDTGFLAPSKVALLLPISDNSRTTLWTGGTGGTTNLYDAVNNTPPIGSATESDTTQIEHAGGAAGTTDYYSANCTTYATAGVASADTVIAHQPVVVWGEDSSTGTKLLSYAMAGTPVYGFGEDSIDVSTGHGSGAVGTYGTGTDYWNERKGSLNTANYRDTIGGFSISASVRISVIRPETASRVASVCFMGIYVAWTPYVAPPASMVVPRRVYPQLIPH